MAICTSDVDGLFAALGDPTRRAVVERLCRGPASVTALREPFDMALPSFLQHLKVLERAGLVSSSKRGRVRTVRIEPVALKRVGAWIDVQRAYWEGALDRLESCDEAGDSKEQHR